MMPGVSYYVLVDKDGNVLEETDMITGYSETMKFDSWEEAEESLRYLLDEELIDHTKNWHIERHRW